MKVLRHFQAGLLSYGTALLLLVRSHMWMALAVPLFLQLGLLWAGEVLADHLATKRFEDITDENAAQYLLLGTKAILVYLSLYMNKYMVLALLAPVLTALSTKTEEMLTGNRYTYGIGQYIKDVQRALMISFRNMGILMVWMGLIYFGVWALSLPEWVHDVGYYAVAFYFYGFSFMDYASERRRLNLGETVAFTRSHAGAAYALGAVYGGMFFIPWVGVVVAPILGAIAGTITVHALVDLRTNPYATKAEAKPEAQQES